MAIDCHTVFERNLTVICTHRQHVGYFKDVDQVLYTGKEKTVYCRLHDACQGKTLLGNREGGMEIPGAPSPIP